MLNKGIERRTTRGAMRRRLHVLAALAGCALAAQAQQPAASAPSAAPGMRGAHDLARELNGASSEAPPKASAARVPPALLDEARRAAAAGDRRRASQLLWQAVPAAPDDVDALVLLGRTELDQVHCTALEQVRRAAALRPADPVAGVLFARTLASCGDQAQSARALDRWIGDPRTSADARAEALAWRAMAEIARGGNALASGEEDARAALRSDDRIPLPWQALFHLHLRQHMFEDALADIDRIAAAGAPAQDLALLRGFVFQRRGRDDEADAALSRTLAIEPGHTTALLLRSAARLHRRDLDGAFQDARELVANQPNSPDYWDAMMEVQFQRGDFKGARDAVDQKIRMVPDQPRFLAQRAELDADLGDDRGAVAGYDRSLELDASDADVWIDRATPLWRLDRGSDAVASCLKGLALSDTPRHRTICTVVEWQAGDHVRAVATLDRMLAEMASIETPDGLYWKKYLAYEMLSYGRMKDAAAWLASTRKEDPENVYVALLLYAARALSGDEAAARAELAARPAQPKPAWEDHLVDYALRRIDDDALVRLSSTGSADDVPGQACESAFYRGLRHWIDDDVAGGRALLANAASTCPNGFNERLIARGWLAAGPGATGAAQKGAR
jgi:predicted Zn-dependent protease